MNSRFGTCLRALLLLLFSVLGCRLTRDSAIEFSDEQEAFQELSDNISFQDAEKTSPEPVNTEEFAMNAAGVARTPHTVRRDLPTRHVDLTMDDVLQIAFQNATILRDLGGTILKRPEALANRYDPRVQETDPRLGVEAALSDFDAQLRVLTNFENNDRYFNNRFLRGIRGFQQDYHDYQIELSKTAVTGTRFSTRWNTDYDANNSPGNLFGSAWTTAVEAEVRQPLLQGAGVNFNRIAGPNGRPGVLHGVVIARVNADIAVTEFETGVQDFISEVENAYWDLYFAYRNLDAKVAARNESLKTLLAIRARKGQLNFEADKEAQAREQYLRFEQDVQDALGGRLVQGTQRNNGSTAGTFRPTSGLYVAERRLRLLLGWPITGEAVIRPSTEPLEAPMIFDWETLVSEAIWQRTELKRERQTLKRLYHELEAHQNFLKPRLDAVARYRFRGFGKDLINGSDPSGLGFNDAYSNLLTGDFQEWMLGLEMNVPLGFREGYTAVRNSELQIARERAVMGELKREIIHNLSNAYAEVQRSWQDTELSRTRLNAAADRVHALEASPEFDVTSTNDLLNAQTLLADAQVRYASSLIDYMLAIRNVHYEKGSLFQYREVYPVNALGDSNYFGEEVYEDTGLKVEPLLPGEQIPEVPEPVVPDQSTAQYDLDLPTLLDKQTATAPPLPLANEDPTPVLDDSKLARIEIVPQHSHPLNDELIDPSRANQNTLGLPAESPISERPQELFDRANMRLTSPAPVANPADHRPSYTEPAYELFDRPAIGVAEGQNVRPSDSGPRSANTDRIARPPAIEERITASQFIAEPITTPPLPAKAATTHRAPLPTGAPAVHEQSSTVDRLFGSDPTDSRSIRFDDPRWEFVD